MKKLFFGLFICLLLVQITMAQQTFRLIPKNIPYTDSTLVFLPQNYSKENTKKYPLLFMLHGWSGNYKQWKSITNLQEYADKYDFIIVCPDGLYDSWYINSPQIPQQQYATFFFEELHPYLLQKYRIDTQNIFITGLSMGGYGAFSLFLQKPAIFKGVAATSALFDLSLFSKRFGLAKTLGGFELEAWKKYNIIEQLKESEGKNKPIFFDCGTSDVFHANNVKFHQECKDLGLQVSFESSAGNHDKNYWKKSVATHFEFFNKLR